MQNESLKIAIVWEQAEWGGVDSYLDYLLSNWINTQDEIVVIHNKKNKGAERLKTLLEGNTKVSFKGYDSMVDRMSRLAVRSRFLKILNHFALPLVFLVSVREYTIMFRDSGFDCVISQNGGYPGSYGNIAAVFGAKKAGIGSRMMVVHHAATKPLLFHGWFRALVENAFSSAVTSLVAVSNMTKGTLLSNTRITDSQSLYVKVIDNGVSEPVSSVIDDSTQELQKKVVIGIVGRLELYKGHEDLLYAIALLDDSYRNQILVKIIGGYKIQEKEYLDKLARKLDIHSCIEFTGYIDKPAMTVFSSLDLTVMLTRTFEGFGLTVVESLKCGTPVLGSDVGIVPALLGYDHPLIVSSGDINSIKRSLEYFLDNPSEEYITSQMRSMLETKFAAKTMADAYRSSLVLDYQKSKLL